VRGECTEIFPGKGRPQGVDVLAINVPSGVMRRALGLNMHIGCPALDRSNSRLPLLTSYVQSLIDLPIDCDPSLMRSSGARLTDLIALILSPTRKAVEQAKHGGLKSARLDPILRTIEANLADPGFSVADIAKQLRVSVHYVQDILQEAGSGFSGRALELRLQEGCNLLSRATSPIA